MLPVSGSTGYYKWYDASGLFAGYGDTLKTRFLSATDSFYVSAYVNGLKQNSLNFDGSNDYVAISNMYYQSTTLDEVTVEAWIRTSDGGDQIIASFDRSDYWRLEINGSGGGTGQIGWDIYTDAGMLDFGSSTRVDDGAWHHVAAVFDHGYVAIYIDGVLDNSTTYGSTFGIGSTRFGYISNGSESSAYNTSPGPNSYFNGDIAEVRIWSVARTQAQIQAWKDSCLTGNESGLEIYYKFNEGSGTTINDYTLNGNTGYMQNMAPASDWTSASPTQYNCEQCLSPRDTAYAEVLPIPRPEIGEDTCAGYPLTLDPGAGYSSYLWNTGATTQSIIADTTGSFSVTVDSAGLACSGSDGFSFRYLPQPTGTDTARCGPGSVSVNATGSVGSYIWYDHPTAGSILGTGSSYSASFSTTDTLYVAGDDDGITKHALEFDGINDFVSLNMYYNTSGQIPQLTLEAWVNTSETGTADFDNWAIIDFDRSEYYNLYIHGDDGRVGFSTTASDGSLDDFYAPLAAAVNDGAWHHIAAVYDGTDKMIYVDGNLVATQTNPHGGNPLGSGTTRYGFIGDGSEASSNNGGRNYKYFSGEIDEVRIWHDVRNILEIQGSKTNCLYGTETGLAAYYKMGDGTGSGSLTDHSGNNHTGTLRNMNTSAAWINTGEDIYCSCGESARDTVVVTIRHQPVVDFGVDTCVADSLWLDAGPGMDSYLWSNGTSGQKLKATVSKAYWVQVDSAGTLCPGGDTVIVSVGIAATPEAKDSVRCGPGTLRLVADGVGEIIWWADQTTGTPLLYGDTLTTGTLNSDSVFWYSTTLADDDALEMDGADDYVAIKDYNYNGSNYTEVTVEAWVRTNQSGDQIIASYDRSEYWRLEINGDGGGPGEIGWDIYTDAGLIDFASSSRIDDGNWHHVAAVYDNGYVAIYIDGVLDNSTTYGTQFGSGSAGFGFLGANSEASVYNGTNAPVPIDGEIDEFRLWSVARTPAEIANYSDTCLSGTETGLEVYYRMDEGSGTTLTDLAGTNDGELFNGGAWTHNGRVINCSACGESDRVAVVATIHDTISDAPYTMSCPGENGTLITLSATGGTSAYDYREINGIFAYSGSYSTTPTHIYLPNGGIYDIEIKDQNDCMDTIPNISTPAGPITIPGSSTTASCMVNDSSDWFYLNDGFNILAAINSKGTDLGDVNVNLYVQSFAASYENEAYMRRHYLIDTENPPGPSGADVRLYFTNWEFSNLQDSAQETYGGNDNVSAISDLGVTKYNGPTEDDVYDPSDATNLIYIPSTSSGTQFANNYIQFNVSSFSEFWIHGGMVYNNSPLPVELISFSVQLQEGGTVNLQWMSGSEHYTSHYQVERSYNGYRFEPLTKVGASGFSSSINYYQSKDNPSATGRVYYRLKIVDTDGSFDYSHVKTVYLEPAHELSVYPNPSPDGYVYVDGLKGDERLQLYNATGQIVQSKRVEGHSISLNIPVKGVYFIHIFEVGANFAKQFKIIVL